MSRLVFVTALAILSATAHAQPSVTPQIEPGEVVTHYRSMTLTADALSFGLLVAGAAAEGPGGRDTETSSNLMAAGALGGLFATPLIHAARGHYGRALGSLLLRSGMGSLGMMIGLATASCAPHELLCGYDRLGPGMLLGLTGASLIDAAWMTEERSAAPTWTPVFAARHGAGTIGLATEF